MYLISSKWALNLEDNLEVLKRTREPTFGLAEYDVRLILLSVGNKLHLFL